MKLTNARVTTLQDLTNEGDSPGATTKGRRARPCLPSVIAGLS